MKPARPAAGRPTRSTTGSSSPPPSRRGARDRRRRCRAQRWGGAAQLISLSVAQIAEIVDGELADISPQAAADLHVTGTVEFDSRKVTPGGLFLALPGARSDGHDHPASAVAAGAGAGLGARPVGVPAIIVGPAGPPAIRRGQGGLAGV